MAGAALRRDVPAAGRSRDGVFLARLGLPLARQDPHVGSTDDGTVHYALAYMGSGVALATYCGRLLAARLAGKADGDAGPLLGAPLPVFPFPALRRIYQRLAYAYYGFKDERL